MKKTGVDRRIARTRAGLQHALIALILRKGYDAITVADICAEANVGRSTFYLHFASKEALKLSGLEHLREELAARQEEALASATGKVGLGFSLGLFEHARDHIDLYRALIGGSGEEIALDGLKRILADLVRRELAPEIGSGTTEEIPPEFVVQYAVGAYMSVLTWWLDRGAQPSAQRMDEMVRHLATRGHLSL
jgi:AcrR family transcriptional regulator